MTTPMAVISSALDMLLVQLGPKIVSALWYIEGPDFRCSFYTDSMGIPLFFRKINLKRQLSYTYRLMK